MIRSAWLVLATLASLDIVGVAGRDPSDAVLIGSGGEIYRRDGESFRRASGGGVASTLVGARGASPAEIWGLGAEAPPFHHDGATWNATRLPAVGPAVLSRAGAPAVAMGRRVFVHSLAKWSQLPVTPVLGGAVVAVWVGGLKDAIVATSAGELFRFDGMVWKAIVPAFADASERVLALHPAGAAVAAVVAIGDRGTVLLVDRAASRRVALDARLAAFQARAAASGPAGRLWLAGTATVSSQEGQVLVRLEAGKLVPVDPIPAVAPDDTISALLVGRDGSALIATRGGAVLTRSAAGAWSSARADAVLPPDTSHPTNPPATLVIPAPPASR